MPRLSYNLELMKFLSTPSARRATRVPHLRRPPRAISIHALREEGDVQRFQRHDQRRVISIHALREEGDLRDVSATPVHGNFYPRPPRGGRQYQTIICCLPLIFLSTPSARRATRNLRRPVRGHQISIHALREEGDQVNSYRVRLSSYFYPRPPRGGRRGTSDGVERVTLFLSTPSARRATAEHSVDGAKRCHFYPRPPRGGRPPVWFLTLTWDQISIHALREEGDRKKGDKIMLDKLFLSTPSARRATRYQPRPLLL